MAIKNVQFKVDEKASLDMSFECTKGDRVTPLNPSNVTVYIFLEGTDPLQFINNRDGGEATGLTVTDNLVEFHLYPDDNSIIGTDEFEYHIVRFKLDYNADMDTEWLDLRLKVRNLGGVT